MAYSKTNWQDLPTTTTPINATRLNNIETGIENNDKRLNGTSPAGEMIVDSIKSKNILNSNELINGTVSATDGSYTTSDIVVVSNYIKVKANTTYIMKLNNVNDSQFMLRAVLYKSNRTYNSTLTTNVQVTQYSFTPSIDGYVRLCFGKGNWDNLTPSNISVANPQLEEGSTATTYSPYQEIEAPNYNYNSWLRNTTYLLNSGYVGVHIYGKLCLINFNFQIANNVPNNSDLLNNLPICRIERMMGIVGYGDGRVQRVYVSGTSLYNDGAITTGGWANGCIIYPIN